MASTIKIKNSSTAGAVPSAGDLVQGELAVNVTDKTIFTENASGTVVELGKNYTGFKNRIINGAMMLHQRGGTLSVSTASNAYSIDRWKANAVGGGVFTLQQSTVAPAGFTNSLLATVTTADASVVSGDFYHIRQPIEGFNFSDLAFGSASASSVSLSFWVRSSVTGTFTANLRNNAGSRGYAASYTISSANTWEYKTITVTGDTTGTWLTDNSTGCMVTFSIGNGDTQTSNSWQSTAAEGITGMTQLISTSGATFYITGVQLEKGSTATSFDYRPYGTELALCQRYAKVFISSSSNGGTCASTTAVQQRFTPPVTMRSAPTATINTAGSWTLSDDYASDYTATTVTISGYNSSVDLVRVAMGGFSGLTAGRFVSGSPGGGTAQILLSSEL